MPIRGLGPEGWPALPAAHHKTVGEWCGFNWQKPPLPPITGLQVSIDPHFEFISTPLGRKFAPAVQDALAIEAA
jgi:hypothetical protein